jgi:hypothetical protein
MNDPSSLARNNAVFATSIGSVKRPKGTFDTKLALFSGVSSTPTKLENKPVPERSGAMAVTRMFSGPYSAARPFVAYPQLSVSSYTKEISNNTYVCHSTFASIIPYQPWSRSRTPNTRDVNDTPSTLFLHLRDRSQNTQIYTLDIDVKHPIKLITCNL